jgi:hypothetical protein
VSNGRRFGSVYRGFAAIVVFGVALSAPTHAAAPAVDMAEVRRLAREPVETIFAGAPIGRISDADYGKLVQESPRPVVVVFYANQDEKSRNLATLARYLALEFSQVITFYGYRATAGTTVDPAALGVLQKQYGLKQIPATLFYDNDRGKIELEKAEHSVPSLVEYRTPGMLFWRTYHGAIRDYIKKSILD